MTDDVELVLSRCRLDTQRPLGQEYWSGDYVMYLQHWVDMCQTALSRLRRRPLKERDILWVADVKQTQDWIDEYQGKLHKVLSERDSRQWLSPQCQVNIWVTHLPFVTTLHPCDNPLWWHGHSDPCQQCHRASTITPDKGCILTTSQFIIIMIKTKCQFDINVTVCWSTSTDPVTGHLIQCCQLSATKPTEGPSQS